MLERERDHILDSFHRHRVRVPWEAFADYDLDPPHIVTRVPAVLVLEFLVEAGKPERRWLAGFGNLYDVAR